MPTTPNSGEAVKKHIDLEIKDVSLIFQSVILELENELGHTMLRFPKEIIWLIGAPGAGKGTNTPFIQKERGFTAAPVVISDLLDSPEARHIKDLGGMVGDKEVMGLLFRELLKPGYQKGIIVDGYPRTKVQAESLKLLYQKMITLRNEFHNTPIEDHFRYPLFRITVLFVEEKISIDRQLYRGKQVREENQRLSEKGRPLIEERKTDYDPALARNRYRVFKEQTFEALQSLRQFFHYHFIDAQATLAEVQWNISKEFQYQSSLELNHETFQMLRHIPLAKEIVVHARQELVDRIESYSRHHLDLFQRIIDTIEKKFIPILHRHVISGYARLNSSDEIFADPLALAMLVDIFLDRGYHVAVDVQSIHIPDRVDPVTHKVHCKVEKSFTFDVRFTGSEIRRG